MRPYQNIFPKMTLALIISTLFFSCSKDADLLSDYVINKTDDIAGVYSLVVDDTYFSDMRSSIVLDVLNNDNYENFNNVNVTETSDPEFGTVVINEDKTLTYIPIVPSGPTTSDLENQNIDTFVYTVEEEIGENGTVNTAVGTVTVKVLSQNEDVQYWKGKFDQEWLENDNQPDRLDALARASSGNVEQEYYFLAYYIDALIKIWQATGENAYLDKALSLINTTVNDAVNVGGGYLGWPNSENKGHPLWDSYYWRYVATLLRIMHKSPNLRAKGNYQEQYDQLLDFTEKHIWERYEVDGLNNFYRINTHMSSHWARIGMELFIITGKEKYIEVFEKISFGNMIGRPSNLRNHLKPNPKIASAYTWSQRWDINQIQDTDHAGAVVSFIVNAHENNMFWDEAHINGLLATLNKVIWKPEFGSQFMSNVDGTGGYDLHGRLHEWLNLGRFDKELQSRIKSSYTGKNLTYYGVQPFGIAALNARILADGRPVYPEEY